MAASLPPHPSLEQLKNQAKDLHRAGEAGDPQALARIRTHLPRLGQASDAQVQAADVSLQEAQHVIAREYGFANWNWLRTIVEVDFDLLVGLTDREIQTLLREVDQKDLVIALKDASEDVKQRLVGQMSERVRAFITEEMEFHGPIPLPEVKEVQRRVLLQTARLADQGQVDWPGGTRSTAVERPSAALSPRLLELVRRDLDGMTPDDLVALWAQVAEQARREGILSLEGLLEPCASPLVREALQLAVDGTEPDVIAVILKQRSEFALLPRLRTRSGMVLEGLAAIAADDSPRVLHHKLGALYRTEPAEPLGVLPEITVGELADRLRSQPIARMDFEQIDALLTDMACLARREGVAALQPLVQAVADPLFARLLQMVCDHAGMEQVVAVAQAQIRETQHQAQTRHRMVIAGIRAIQEGQTPEEVERQVRAAGA